MERCLEWTQTGHCAAHSICTWPAAIRQIEKKSNPSVQNTHIHTLAKMLAYDKCCNLIHLQCVNPCRLSPRCWFCYARVHLHRILKRNLVFAPTQTVDHHCVGKKTDEETSLTRSKLIQTRQICMPRLRFISVTTSYIYSLTETSIKIYLVLMWPKNLHQCCTLPRNTIWITDLTLM